MRIKRNRFRLLRMLFKRYEQQRLPARSSKAEYALGEYLIRRGVKIERQKHIRVWNQVERRRQTRYFDIYVPAHNTVVEFQGCRWHYCSHCGYGNTPEARKKWAEDAERHRELVAAGYKVIYLYEHDWRRKNLSSLDPLFQHRGLFRFFRTV